MKNKVDQKFVDRFTQAERLCNDNKLDESLQIYQTLLREHPDHVSVLNNIGLIKDYYSRCNALMPNQVVIINNLANAYTRLSKWSEAFPLLQKIIDTDFDNEKNSEKYALCLFHLRSKEEVRDFTRLAVSKYPDNKILNRILGNSLLHLNAHSDGLQYLQKGAGFIEFDNKRVSYLN